MSAFLRARGTFQNTILNGGTRTKFSSNLETAIGVNRTSRTVDIARQRMCSPTCRSYSSGIPTRIRWNWKTFGGALLFGAVFASIVKEYTEYNVLREQELLSEQTSLSFAYKLSRKGNYEALKILVDEQPNLLSSYTLIHVCDPIYIGNTPRPYTQHRDTLMYHLIVEGALNNCNADEMWECVEYLMSKGARFDLMESISSWPDEQFFTTADKIVIQLLNTGKGEYIPKFLKVSKGQGLSKKVFELIQERQSDIYKTNDAFLRVYPWAIWERK